MFHRSDCKHISDAVLDEGIIQLSYVIESSGLPGNVVVLLSAADWRCILELKDIHPFRSLRTPFMRYKF
jgi:hypothetical protein